MPTKLEKPIALTVETIEEAAVLWHRLNVGTRHLDSYFTNPSTLWVKEWAGSSALWDRFNNLIAVAGIDITKEPPQPFKIGAHETTFNPNGSIRVGCTDIDRATLVEVLKRSDEAMKGESEWPKYYQCDTERVFRANDNSDFGTWMVKGRLDEKDGGAPIAVSFARSMGYKQITRAEACAILGRDV